MSGTRAVIEAFFARSSANDANLVDLFADEVEFFAPGDPKYFPWAGIHTQRGELLEAFKQIWSSRRAGSGSIVRSKLIVEGEDAAWIGVGVSHEINEFGRNE